MSLRIVPCDIRTANAFVAQHHRHHGPVVGAKFTAAVADGDWIVGVAIVGRPVARPLDDGWTLEVVRVATDGTRNACSILYGCAWRVALQLGYQRIVTYTLCSESGASLRAAGYRPVERVRGRSWSCPSRPREDKGAIEDRFRWEKAAWASVPADEQETSAARNGRSESEAEG